jgi:hypothetical protein
VIYLVHTWQRLERGSVANTRELPDIPIAKTESQFIIQRNEEI